MGGHPYEEHRDDHSSPDLRRFVYCHPARRVSWQAVTPTANPEDSATEPSGAGSALPAVEGDSHPSSHREAKPRPGGPVLWSFAWSLVVTFAAALVVLLGLFFLSALWLGHPSASPHMRIGIGDELNLIKIILAIIAGAGGIVALVVAYRRQRVLEYSARLEHSRERREDVRVLNERFAAATSQLGSDSAAVRLAGIYAIAGLADDWEDQRQVCIDVLCAFLRMPYAPAPEEVNSPEYIDWTHQRMVRHTVIRVVASHLQATESAASWHGYDFDFTGVVFDGGDFSNSDFHDVRMDFTSAQFVDGRTNFIGSRFSECEITFDWAVFSGGEVNFGACNFLSDCHMTFIAADIRGGEISFGDMEWAGAKLNDGNINFSAASLRDDGVILFVNSECKGTYIGFAASHFLGGRLIFMDAKLSGGEISFESAKLMQGTVNFESSDFIGCAMNFHHAEFLGTTVDFSKRGEWVKPPTFDKWETPPIGLRLPPVNPEEVTIA
jgi:uncharacterized protein YjbI with pentapeptide repeats